MQNQQIFDWSLQKYKFGTKQEMKEQKGPELNQSSLIKLWRSLSPLEQNEAKQIFNQEQINETQQQQSHKDSPQKQNSQSKRQIITEGDLLTTRQSSASIKNHKLPSSKETDSTLQNILDQSCLYEVIPLQKPLKLNKITLKSISTFSYKMLFGQLIEFSQFCTISFTESKIQSYVSKYDILHIFQHAEESKLEEICLKLPIYSKILTVISSVKFPCLKMLNLSCCEITSIEPFIWMNLPHLVHLNLEWNFISSMESLSKMIFEKKPFSSLWLNNNMVKKFDKLNRVNVKKLQSCRTDSIPAIYELTRQQNIKTELDPQSEDISFLVKIPFQTQCMRIGNRHRILQKQVLDCVYRMDRLMHLSK